MSKKHSGNVARRTFGAAPTITPEREAPRRKFAPMNDADINVSDTSTVSKDAHWTRSVELDLEPKQLVSIRLDQSVIDYFKQQGPGYQTRINAVLRQYIQAHS